MTLTNTLAYCTMLQNARQGGGLPLTLKHKTTPISLDIDKHTSLLQNATQCPSNGVLPLTLKY
jgi:hypothetical protein